MLTAEYIPALNAAIRLMESCEIEPRSALKQCASDNGIPYGEPMAEFVEWAERRLYDLH